MEKEIEERKAARGRERGERREQVPEAKLLRLTLPFCLASLAVILYLVLAKDHPVLWFSVVVMGILMVICEGMGESMVLGGRSTYGIIAIFAAVSALNTPSAMIVALCGGLRLGRGGLKDSPVRMAYNGAMYALATWASSAVYHSLGGSSKSFDLGAGLRSILPLLVAAAVFWTLNAAGMALVLHGSRGTDPLRFLMTDALRLLPNQLLYGLIGLAMGIIYAQNAFHLLPDTEQVVGSTAEYLRGLFSILALTAVLGSAWYYSGRNIELLESYDRSLETLLTYLERREPYLDGHAVRVAEYAAMIGRKMKLPYYEVNRLRHAALLHDLGRPVIPLSVLLQDGPLTEEEFEAVKAHPLEGSSRLEEVEYLSDMAEAVRHHHEYFDGGGYIDNLAGETIPLHARIIAVADAYDAMLHARPHREAKGEEWAVAELRQNSGLQFDPRVVESFLAALEERREAERGMPAVEGTRVEPKAEEERKEIVPRSPRGRRARRREERLRERREARERLEREALRALEEEAPPETSIPREEEGDDGPEGGETPPGEPGDDGGEVR